MGKYLLYVHDYSQLGFSESEARISFYGEEVVKMEVEDGNNEDRYWMLGSFEPSEGVSLFSIDGEFQTDNPDTSARGESVSPENLSTFFISSFLRLNLFGKLSIRTLSQF